MAIIEKKRKAGRDLVRTELEPRETEAEPDEDIDLLETIRRSLRRAETRSTPGRRSALPATDKPHATRKRKTRGGTVSPSSFPETASCAMKRAARA